MAANYGERDVTFDIVEEIGILSTQETGWTKELNLVRWNGGLAKYDIREWDPMHERMSRGITLKEEEMRRILDLMRRRRSRNRNHSDPSRKYVSGRDNTSSAFDAFQSETELSTDGALHAEPGRATDDTLQPEDKFPEDTGLPADSIAVPEGESSDTAECSCAAAFESANDSDF